MLLMPKLDSLAHMLISNTKRNKIIIILLIVSHKLCMYKSMHGEHIFAPLAPTHKDSPYRNKVHSSFMHDIFGVKNEIYFVTDIIVCRFCN